MPSSCLGLMLRRDLPRGRFRVSGPECLRPGGPSMVSTDPATLYPHPDRNIALELVRATEAASIRAYPWIGRGDKLGADGAAVDAMRAFLGTVNFEGVVVIGEGEKD